MLEQESVEVLRSGFGPTSQGEDMFDAVLGLCGMLEPQCAMRGFKRASSQFAAKIFPFTAKMSFRVTASIPVGFFTAVAFMFA